MVLGKTLESLLDSKEIKPVNPKGDQSWVFIGRTDAEAETPILWPPDARADSLGKTLMLRKVKGVGATEDAMVGWHHQLSGHEFQQTLEIMKDREAWHAAVLGAAKSLTT